MIMEKGIMPADIPMEGNSQKTLIDLICLLGEAILHLIPAQARK